MGFYALLPWVCLITQVESAALFANCTVRLCQAAGPPALYVKSTETSKAETQNKQETKINFSRYHGLKGHL